MNPIKHWKTTLAGGLFAALIAIQQFTSTGGDVSDWKQWIIPALIALLGVLLPDPRSGGKPPYHLPLLVFPLLLCQCATEQSTDAELQRAQSAMEAAAVTYDLALLIYEPRLTSGSPEQKLVAQKIIDLSRKRLADEKARLADIQARRETAKLVAALPSGDGTPPASHLLPPPTAP